MSSPNSGTRNPTSDADQPTSVNGTNGIEKSVVVIADEGDIILHLGHENEVQKFRVQSRQLSAQSKFFERLLLPGRFGEGQQLKDEQEILRARYGTSIAVPIAELPQIIVKDLGRISQVKSIVPLATDFLSLLHGHDILSFNSIPIANLANLVVVADRFDALGSIKHYVERKRVLQAIDGKTSSKADNTLSEERVRQRLFVAVMLEHAVWTEKFSARLITKGWVGAEVDVSSPLWWDIPAGIEDELAVRREYVLETIQSIQSQFLALYTSRDRQCKLGYDSSAQCDAFQLGEMIRFFRKMNTLVLRGTILDNDELPERYDGEVLILLDSLRQVPEYQIDRNHNHCGIRTRMIPLLDHIQGLLPHVGICWKCWSEMRGSYAWSQTKRPLSWMRHGSASVRTPDHAARHTAVRTMFMATDRMWT